MNCSQCNQPLAPNAHFCGNCGILIAPASSGIALDETQRVYPLPTHPQPPVSPGLPMTPPALERTQPPLMGSPTANPSYPQNPMSPSGQPAPLSYYQANQNQSGANMFPATVNANPRAASRPARRSGRAAGCIGCLTVIVILLVIVGAGWIFGVQPYIHTMAQTQIDNAMERSVQQIPSQAAQLPAGSTIPVQDSTLTNMIVLNLAPSDPIKQPAVSITPQGIRLDFQIATPIGTMSSAIAGVPKTVNGQLQMSNVTVEGPVGLVMSPADFTTLLNKHFAEAQTRLQHQIKSVQLKDHEMDLVLG
jgi:hypothetical protein